MKCMQGARTACAINHALPARWRLQSRRQVPCWVSKTPDCVCKVAVQSGRAYRRLVTSLWECSRLTEECSNTHDPTEVQTEVTNPTMQHGAHLDPTPCRMHSKAVLNMPANS